MDSPCIKQTVCKVLKIFQYGKYLVAYVLKMYIQRLNYQVFPMKTSEAFQIWTKCVKNKWEGNRVPLSERKLDYTLTKEPQNYSSHFV